MTVAAASLGFVAGPVGVSHAQAGDGSVTVRVVNAVTADGAYRPVVEPGMAGVTVNLTDNAGNKISGVTAADGTVTLNPAASPLTGGQYRVEVVNPKPGVLFPVVASTQGLTGAPTQKSSNEEFVDLSGGKNVSYTTGLWDPDNYCQDNAPLITACIPKYDDASVRRTLVSAPYQSTGNNVDTTTVATNADTGALYGIAYSRQAKQVFSSATAHRMAPYGPGGPGAIYVTPVTPGPNGSVTNGATRLFATVPGAGSTAHTPTSSTDAAFIPAPGKESLGDLDISSDGQDLYVVNLNDKKLYRYDANTAALKGSYEIPDPGCATPEDWRPYGLGFNQGKLYVGGVCSAQSSQNASDLKAVVQTFDPANGSGAFTGIVLNQPLTFPRPASDTLQGTCPGKQWYPWTDSFPAGCGARVSYPQPMLADIEFEMDGSLILGFRDRFGDQFVNWSHRAVGVPASAVGDLDPSAGGDMYKACQNGGTGEFVMDVNGGCGKAGNGSKTYDVRRTVWHNNAPQGGLALSKVETSIAGTMIDPIDYRYSGGIGFTDRASGARASGLGNHLTGWYTNGAPSPEMGSNQSAPLGSFGKANSMGDLEVLCDLAPIQIGNRVWYDDDQDGIQDPTEKPVSGATVNLYDAGGSKIATTTTTARGEYYFDSLKYPALKYNTQYTVRMDNPADYQAGGPLVGWSPTTANAGGNRAVDNKGVVPPGGTYAQIGFTTGGPGENNHTLDFGFAQKLVVKKSVDHDWNVAGGTVTYSVDVTNPSGGDRNGVTFVDDLSKVMTNAARLVSATATVDGVPVTPQPVFNATAQQLTWQGTVPGNKTVRFTYQMRVNRVLTGTRILDNKVTVSNSNCEDGTDPACTTRVRLADIFLTKTQPRPPYFPGVSYSYRVTVQNTGAVDFVGNSPAVLTDNMTDVLDDATYDGNLTQVSGPAATTLSITSQGFQYIGNLKAGEQVDFTYSVTIKRRGYNNLQLNNNIVNGTKLQAPEYRSVLRPRDGGVPVPDNCQVDPLACETTGDVAYLDIRKSVTPYALQPGEKATYTWKLTNISNVDFGKLPQTVEDPLDSVLKFADYDNDAKVVSGPGSVKFQNGKLIWTGGGPSKTQSIIRFTVTVRKNALNELPTDGSVRVPNQLYETGGFHGYNCPIDDPTFPPEPICKASFMIYEGPKPPVPPVPPVIPIVRPILPKTGMDGTALVLEGTGAAVILALGVALTAAGRRRRREVQD